MNSSEVAKDRKNRIVKATAECVVLYGYHNFSMHQVAELAGVTKGIIHYYYLNKDELMLSVLAMIFENLKDDIENALLSVSGATQKLEIFISKFLDISYRHKEFYEISLDFWACSSEKSKVYELCKRQIHFFHQTCETLIEEGYSKQEFSGVSAKESANCIVSMVYGLSLNKTCAFLEIERADLSDYIMKFIFSGLLKKINEEN